ncbi:MAG: hypothetical protein U9R36_05310, partial [Elusimicrobiota bacterium]|nr:hypothetical protein [Elusimicrobiota bacterium]
MPFSRLDSIKAVTGRKYPWAKIVLISLFAVIVGRLVYLQLIRGQYYWDRAESNRIQEFFIKAPRGRIYSRQGEKLVGNQPMYALLMATEGSDIGQRKASAEKISELTGRPLKELISNINAKERHPFGVVEVISNLRFREILIIEEHSHYLPNVFIEVRPRRRYPYGENGAHLFGYIGEISRRELGRLRGKGFKQKDLIGKTGIEKSYDSMLRGVDGFKKIEVGVKGKHRKLVSSRPP